ncbi:hypothetical protein JQX13_48610 [Archangium violaceum]|uniref:hypothetical protein n=1 Tax=Archangium violaceum TaxID=83451 RepID=UPI00193BEC9B|nr:hypothetical protein [Archangium violaceum]QRK07765.1 hypothetical protein JQX13_48610 [Archangium violaceum]
MRVNLALSAAVASLLFAAPVLAEQPTTTGQTAPADPSGRHHKKGGWMRHRFERMEHRLNRAVENGRLTREQADQFLAEARQLRDETRSLREANGGRLTEEQKQQLKTRKQALREKVRAAMQATQPQGK